MSPHIWEIVQLSKVPAVPWHNGGGVTRELAVSRGADAAEDWSWRISLAYITSEGPFSHLPGVQRLFAVTEGAGVELALQGKIGDSAVRALDAKAEPFRFDGDGAVTCHLVAGPVCALNLMAVRGRTTATMARVAGRMRVAAVRDTVVAIYANDTGAVIREASRLDQLDISPRCLAWRSMEAPMELEIAGSSVICMTMGTEKVK